MASKSHLPDPQLFQNCSWRSKKSTWSSSYNGLAIRADTRIHEFVAWYIYQFIHMNSPSTLTCTDLAVGSGACISRIADLCSCDFSFSINDYESQFSASNLKLSSQYSLDLNEYHSLPPTNIALAIEVIEHLENPKSLIKTISGLLSDSSFAILSTPNTNSLLDRYTFMRYGHELYFGQRGLSNSGGHLYSQPRWLLQKFFTDEGLHWQHYGLSLWDSIGTYAKLKSIPSWLMSLGTDRTGLNDSINIWILSKAG